MSRSLGSALRRLGRLARGRRQEWLYRDGVVRLDHQGIVIRRYYWPGGGKRIPYTAIEGVTVRPLKAWHGQFRVQGMDLRGRWYSHDRERGDKEIAIDLDVGARIRPVLTPDEPDRVVELLHLGVSKAHAEDTRPA